MLTIRILSPMLIFALVFFSCLFKNELESMLLFITCICLNYASMLYYGGWSAFEAFCSNKHSMATVLDSFEIVKTHEEMQKPTHSGVFGNKPLLNAV